MSPGIVFKTENSTERVLEELKPILRQISELKASKLFELGKNKFKGSFFQYDVSNVKDKKKLLSEINEYIRSNGLELVIRISSDTLYIGKSYASEIHFFMPSHEILQSFVANAIKNGSLSGNGYELYANPNMGVLAKVKDGSVEKVVPISSASIGVDESTGRFELGGLERGGWVIPKNAMRNYSSFIQKYHESYIKSNSPDPDSMFNLMGTAKMSFNGARKLHFRSIVFPGTLHELPMGAEAGIIDDLYNQTTAGCLFVGEGRYRVLTSNGKTLTGKDSNLRHQDIGIAIKKGRVKAEELKPGFKLPMRKGGEATLSLDSYGNQVWLDEEGFYVSFDSVNFDWDSPDMPQVVFMPPHFGDSEFINKDLVGKTIFIDTRIHYEFARRDKISVVIFPDRHNILNASKVEQIKKEILETLKEHDLNLSSDQLDNFKEYIWLSQVTPININIDTTAKFAKR